MKSRLDELNEWREKFDTNKIEAKDWAKLREHAEMQWNELEDDHRRFKSTMNQTALFASSITTAALGIAKLSGSHVTCAIAFAATFGLAAAAIAFWLSGTHKFPTRHRTDSLADEISKGRNADEWIALGASRGVAIGRDKLASLNKSSRAVQVLVVLALICIAIEVIITAFR
ncbi:hypothetical protein [Rosistilla oblonga]|uniref:hypothetical protein n=1 Tax=Rosistilla oblonga TaxID=2527990 RepID=UPI003A96A146